MDRTPLLVGEDKSMEEDCCCSFLDGLPKHCSNEEWNLHQVRQDSIEGGWHVHREMISEEELIHNDGHHMGACEMGSYSA